MTNIYEEVAKAIRSKIRAYDEYYDVVLGVDEASKVAVDLVLEKLVSEEIANIVAQNVIMRKGYLEALKAAAEAIRGE